MTEKNIYTALIGAQKSFGTVVKGSTNPAFKSKYADLSDVVSAVVPTLNANGICVIHYTKGGDMRTELVHAESGTKVWCDIPLTVDKNNMQGFKSATTYAKRIGLESLTGVAPEDDDGNAAAAAPAPKAAAQKPASPAPSAADILIADIEKKVAAAQSVDDLQQVFVDNRPAYDSMLDETQQKIVNAIVSKRKKALEENPFKGVTND